MGPSADIAFRAAEPDDASVCGELCLLVFAKELEGLFSGLKGGVSTGDVVRALCGAADTEFSWRHFTLVEQDGIVVAGLCAFPAEELPRLIKQLPVHLQEDCGIGVGGLARLFLRSLWFGTSRRGPQPPPGSLYIPVGAVFPAHQRNGLARRTLTHLFERARAEGFQQVCLHVERTNSSAMGLYAALGFRELPGRPSARNPLMTLPLR